MLRRIALGAIALLALAFVPSAQGAPLGIAGFFGNPGAAGETVGGRFSTTPQGVAVNQATGKLYVADAGNSRIERFDEEGDFEWALGIDVIAHGKPGNQPQNEVQTIALNGTPTGGTFTLQTGNGIAPVPSSAPIPYNATPAQVQAALEGLATNGASGAAVSLAGNVTVTLAPGGNPGGEAGIAGGPWIVEFVAGLADANVRQMTAVATNLLPAGRTITVATTTEGAAFVEKCTVAADCKAGTPRQGGNFVLFAANSPVPGGGAASPQGLAINQTTGDLYVSDSGYRRVQQLDEDGNFIRAWGGDVALAGPEQADERQRLTVDATSGAYKLTYFATSGRGRVVNGSTTVSELRTFAGTFAVGQPISGQGIPAGATIAAVGAGTLTLSAPATANANNANLVAGPSFTTADIAFNASAAQVQAQLEALGGIGVGNVTVSGGPGSAGGSTPYLVSFGGSLANGNLAPLVASAGTTPLAGGTGAAIATFNEGGEGFEVCEVAVNCKAGAEGETGGFIRVGAAGYLAVAPAGAPDAGNLVMGESDRVQEFSAGGQFVRAFGWDTVSSGPGEAGSGFEVCRAAALDICASGTAGNGVGQIATETRPQIAIDSAGAIYTLENATCSEQSRLRRVQKFSPQAGPPVLSPAVFAEAVLAVTNKCAGAGAKPNVAPEAIAYDATENHVYVVKAYEAGEGVPPAASPERRALEFDTSGTLLETHLVNYGVPVVNGLAVRSGGSAAYLSSPAPKPGVFIAGSPSPPHPTISAPSGLSAECATLHGTVDPEGGGPLHTFYRFEYRAVGATPWSKAPASDVDLGSGEAPVAVEQTVCALQPKREYEAKLVATKGGNPVSAGPITFLTDPAAANAETFEAFFDLNAADLVLRGAVNPNNTATTYYFEYGTAPCSSSECTAIPASKDASAGAGGELKAVSQRVAGTAPNTTYHFRIVAGNGVGIPAVGAEKTFTTPAATPACTNASLKTGPSQALMECRAYEWVSAGDSWGSGIGSEMGAIADSGERARFSGQAFGQPPSVPGPSTPYISERTDAGWRVHQVVPQASFADGSYGGTRFMAAADLGSVLWPQSNLGQRLRGEVRWGTVSTDGSEAWASELLVPVNHAGTGSTGDEYPVIGAAADLSSFVFVHSAAQGSVALLAGEPILPNSKSNLYQVVGGDLGIVNRGGPPSGGNPLGVIGGRCGAGLGAAVGLNLDSGPATGAVSADGSVVHFSARPTSSVPEQCAADSSAPKRLFKRINANTTVEVSACAKSDPNACTTGGDDNYRGASRNGSVTFFVSPRQLTDSDSDATSDLYVYDESLASGERLIQASAGEVVPGDHPTIGAGAEVEGVLDNAGDGSRVYFVAKGRLTGEASKGTANLYAFERDDANPEGRIAFVGALAGGEANATNSSFALPGGEEGDGRFLLFTSAAQLLPEDLDSSKDLYRYDDEAEALRCLSCMGEEEADVASVGGERTASADVSAVVFTTKEGLSDEDLNGASDAYLWRAGALSLVSAGSGTEGVQGTARISADGEDVFFIARSAMVGADRNNSLDLYDARVGGGFAEAPAVVPCPSGEACQGPGTSTAPAKPLGGSHVLQSAGNPKQPKPCKKGFVRKRGKCVKKNKGTKRNGKKKAGKGAGAKRGADR